jgi:hypothetical protein
MDYKVKTVRMVDEFKICPSCGYEDGFHSMLKKVGDINKWNGCLSVRPAMKFLT